MNDMKTKTVALILESNREYGRELIKGIAHFADGRKNWQLELIPQLGIDPKRTIKACDGIIARITDAETMKQLVRLRRPIIDLFIQCDKTGAIGVGCDNRKIADIAAKYLIRRGFRNFAFCGYKGTRYSDEREAAFSKSLSEAGYTCDAFRVVEKPPDIISYGDQSMRPRNMKRFSEWVAGLPPQTAVFCANDIRAYHVLRVCRKLGREVPSEIAIMGVDNDAVLCACTPTALTSIDPNAFGVGYAAARILNTAMEHPNDVRKRRRPFYVAPNGIVERKSTAVYPVKLKWMTEVLTYIENNISKPISAKTLCRRAKVSQTALQKAFKKTFATSAGRYVLSEKMREAKRLVDEGGLLVKEISSRVGFASPKYFCRTYHAYFGHPPTNRK